MLASSGGHQHRVDYTWPTWNSIGHPERLKAGAPVLADAFDGLAADAKDPTLTWPYPRRRRIVQQGPQ